VNTRTNVDEDAQSVLFFEARKLFTHKKGVVEEKSITKNPLLPKPVVLQLCDASLPFRTREQEGGEKEGGKKVRI
jgi:hypothetical protein